MVGQGCVPGLTQKHNLSMAEKGSFSMVKVEISDLRLIIFQGLCRIVYDSYFDNSQYTIVF